MNTRIRRVLGRSGVLLLSAGLHVTLWAVVRREAPNDESVEPVTLTVVDVLDEVIVPVEARPVAQVEATEPAVTPATPKALSAPVSTPRPRATPAPRGLPDHGVEPGNDGPTRATSTPAPPDYGVELGNDGPPSIPAGPRSPGRAPVATVRKLGPAPASGCGEQIIKPRALVLPQPAYAETARAAGVQGKVRVQLEVGADGSVGAARVVSSLDPGLDAAALTAVRSARFSPATRCGKPVAGGLTIAITFSL